MRPLVLFLVLATACNPTSKPGDTGPQDSGPLAVDSDGDGFSALGEGGDDCDDSNADVHPGAPESCNGLDDDCDGQVDDDVTDATTWYGDADGDGYGDTTTSVVACDPPKGAVAVGGDCDDTNAEIWPGASERCDGLDNDCDKVVDEDVLDTWYPDTDGDTYGDSSAPLDSCDPPKGWVADGTDCDDSLSAVSPGATEICDEIDNNCDFQVDEGVQDTFFADADSDGWGRSSSFTQACSLPVGYAESAGDCDDVDPLVNPDATEVCNSLDDDCDKIVDEPDAADAPAWFADSDHDGAGDAHVSQDGCSAPIGFVASADDCDDLVAAIHPGADEYCDGIDNNCDGVTDEGSSLDATTWFEDRDADGFGNASSTMEACLQPAGFVGDDTDCDDRNDTIRPTAFELCDGVDNDCDQALDESDALDASTWYTDGDTDSFGDPLSAMRACTCPLGRVSDDTDCDDSNASIFPGAAEICNGMDDDCDGRSDEPDAQGTPTWYQDSDGDLYGSAAVSTRACSAPMGYVSDNTDCNDRSGAVNPDATEICDRMDNDCDGLSDESDASNAPTWYLDGDGDSYGDAGMTTRACSAPTGYVASSTDCDDAMSSVHPNAPELCNGWDDDCDGTTDEDNAADAPVWYFDADSDGYGGTAPTTRACTLPAGYSAFSTDCDDQDAAIHPTAIEMCDSRDNDCDGQIDENALDASIWYIDYDADNHGSASYSLTQCTWPAGYSSLSDDCVDTASNIHPGATEFCDGLDTDCNGVLDDDYADDALTWYADADGDTYGELASPRNACTVPSGFVADSTDCNDAQATAFPGSTATEVPGDGIDNDCDGNDLCTDLNCDGRADLVLPSHYDNDYITSSYLYYSDGSSFSDTRRAALPTLGTMWAIAEDLDQDGYQDVAFSNCYDNTTYNINAYIYWGSAAGHSTADRTSLPGGCTYHMLAQDLDDDGWTDLVLATYVAGTSASPSYSSNSYVYWGSASGYSTTDRTSLPTIGAFKAAAGDLDSDGYTDLVFCDYYDGDYNNTSYVYWGSATGYDATDRTAIDTIGCTDVAVADLNADGYSEIAFASHHNGSTYSSTSYIYWGLSSGYSSAWRTALSTQGSLGVEIGDVNQDGWDDVVFGGYYADAWSNPAYTRIFYGSSLGISPTVFDSLLTTGAYDIQLRDLDGDDAPELFVPRYYGGSSYVSDSYVYWNQGTGFLATDRFTMPSTEGAVHGTFGDLNKDGYTDMAVSGYHNGAWTTPSASFVYWGTATGFSATGNRLVVWGVWAPPVMVGAE